MQASHASPISACGLDKFRYSVTSITRNYLFYLLIQRQFYTNKYTTYEYYQDDL